MCVCVCVLKKNFVSPIREKKLFLTKEVHK